MAERSSAHEIVTAAWMGWSELKNGDLLMAAESNGFDVLLTGDGTLKHEQNLEGRCLAVIALTANNWPIVKQYVGENLAALDTASPGSFQILDCGRFNRKRTR